MFLCFLTGSELSVTILVWTRLSFLNWTFMVQFHVILQINHLHSTDFTY